MGTGKINLCHNQASPVRRLIRFKGHVQQIVERERQESHLRGRGSVVLKRPERRFVRDA
ncbi:hypothetical protein CTA2_10495 [Colletotrichum tanaceti]|nr:hypothetical protein CTA2_10495 [Colletotrichum tanaceti]